jgi:mono/diheme cytochrome c family protein
MNHATLSLAAAALLALAVATACGTTTIRHADPTRGRYLVEQVGLCIDCHCPRDEKGEPLPEKWLQGAPIPFNPTIPMPWAAAAPPIAGLPQMSDEQAVHFLQTGELPGGRRPRPPMPPYRMSEQDAKDVVAYLRNPIQPTAGGH